MGMYAENEAGGFDKYDEWRLHMSTLMSAPLVDFDINVRILCSLDRAGIRRLGDLVRLSREELMRVRRLGVTYVAEVERELAKFGLRLGMKW